MAIPTPEAEAVIVMRTFEAPWEKVFQAWTDPAEGARKKSRPRGSAASSRQESAIVPPVTLWISSRSGYP